MPHTQTFYIDSITEEPKEVEDNPREYTHMDGKYTAQSKMVIEVYAYAGHREHARKLYQALKTAGISAYHVRIETDE